MSSSSIAEVEVISNAAAAGRPLTTRAGVSREGAEDTLMARAATLQTEGELALAAADAATVSNVIEFDSPQRRAVVGRAHHEPSRPRIDPRGVALAVCMADTVVIAAAGAIVYFLQAGVLWPLDPTTALTALAIMGMVLRRPRTDPLLLTQFMRQTFSRRVAEGAFRTLLPFMAAVAVVSGLIPDDNAAHAPLTHWLSMWAMAAVGGVCAVRIGLSGTISYWRNRGYMRERVAIYGTGELAQRLLDYLSEACADTVEVVGIFDDRARGRVLSADQRGLMAGNGEDLIAMSRHRDIDRVLLALPHSAAERVVQIVRKLRLMPVEISLAPDQAGFNLACKEDDDLSSLPLMEVHGRPLSFGQVLLKAAVDRALAATALVLGSPLFLAVALAIKLDSRGPIFFRQNRHGFGDRVIGVYKFRTMTAAAAEPNGESQSRPNDPRVTRVGRFLRRWSIDEVPQLINVLRGDMSLVGPRPHAISMQVEERPNRDIVPDYAMRHHVKPGITGWAQINGYHGPVATEEALRARVRYDIEYINNWSLWFDFQIMLRTLKTVLGQRHAY